MFKAAKDGDENVFAKVKVIDETPEGFTEVDSYFVDSSGFGGMGEAAITADQFLGKVKAGRHYAITGQGQFQVHIGEFTKDKKKRGGK